jgi:5-methylcytosine-specific restriction endonuclease McrA
MELQSKLDAVRRKYFDCTHPRVEPRLRIAVNGSEMRAAQCLDCGRQVGVYMKKADCPPNMPPWDLGLENEWSEREQSEVAAIRLESDRIRDEAFSLDKEKYREYLESTAWKNKRILVLNRDGHKCKGCGVATATDVHHLTYAHIYDEFLFELISLCRRCHDRVHADNTVYSVEAPEPFEHVGTAASRVMENLKKRMETPNA